MTLASDGTALIGLWFDGQAHDRETLSVTDSDACSVATVDLPVFVRTCAYLDAYFSHSPLPDLPPLAPCGTSFRQSVFRLLCEIPYGESVSYGTLAERLSQRYGRPAGARAVGAAVGRNPISILIPCHRVIGSDRTLTGYAGGLERKRFLLTWEGIPFSEKNGFNRS